MRSHFYLGTNSASDCYDTEIFWVFLLWTWKKTEVVSIDYNCFIDCKWFGLVSAWCS